MACAVIRACSRLGVKSVAVYSEAERDARHVRLADEAVLLGPAPATESYLDADRLVEAARRTQVEAVLPVPPALAGNARLANAVVAAGLRWVGPAAEVLGRLGGDGVEPASERGFLAWVTAEGLHHVTPVLRDRAGGTPRVSWTPAGGLGPLPPAARRLPELGWRGLVPGGIDPQGELAGGAAGVSPGMARLGRPPGAGAGGLAPRRRGGRRVLPGHGRAGALARRGRRRAGPAQPGGPAARAGSGGWRSRPPGGRRPAALDPAARHSRPDHRPAARRPARAPGRRCRGQRLRPR